MYDSKCRDLAESFLCTIEGCTDKDVDKLAKAIEDLCADAQDEIEIREQATHA